MCATESTHAERKVNSSQLSAFANISTVLKAHGKSAVGIELLVHWYSTTLSDNFFSNPLLPSEVSPRGWRSPDVLLIRCLACSVLTCQNFISPSGPTLGHTTMRAFTLSGGAKAGQIESMTKTSGQRKTGKILVRKFIQHRFSPGPERPTRTKW